MATVYEKIESRAGSTSGLLGASGFSTTWNVTMDAVGDDPVTTLQTTSGGVGIGTPHEWDASQVAQQFTRLDQQFPNNWNVRVDYQLPLVVDDPTGDTNGWRFSLDSSLETELVTHDLNGKLIGAGAYRPVSLIIDKDPESPTFGLPIATDTAKDQNLASFYPSIDLSKTYKALGQFGSDRSLVPVNLYRIADRQRSQPMSRTIPVSTLAISRTFPTMTLAEIAAVNQSNNTINSNPFFGADPGTLKITGANVSDRPGEIAGQTNPGVVYDVSMIFQHRSDGHSPVNQAHTFIDAFGNESVITGPDPAGTPDTIQSDDYVLYHSGTFAFGRGDKFQIAGLRQIAPVPIPRNP